MAEGNPVYLIQVQKVTARSGESVIVTTNVPKSATEEELYTEVKKVCDALDRRLVEQNQKVLDILDAEREAFKRELDSIPQE